MTLKMNKVLGLPVDKVMEHHRPGNMERSMEGLHQDNMALHLQVNTAPLVVTASSRACTPHNNRVAVNLHNKGMAMGRVPNLDMVSLHNRRITGHRLSILSKEGIRLSKVVDIRHRKEVTLRLLLQDIEDGTWECTVN